MSELKRYVNNVSWTESVSQHKEAIIFMHDRQIKSLERQLAEARATRYREITAIRTRFEVFIRGEWSAQEFRDYMKQLKEKGE